MWDYLIQQARVVDGSGAPSFVADVAIGGDTIAEVGTLAVHGVAVRPGHPVVLGVAHGRDLLGATPVLGDKNGPNSSSGQGANHLTPSQTICPGDMYTTQVIAVDYPLYEASPLFNSQTPSIGSSSGNQADISISQPLVFTYGTPSAGAPSTAPLSIRRGTKLVHRK